VATAAPPPPGSDGAAVAETPKERLAVGVPEGESGGSAPSGSDDVAVAVAVTDAEAPKERLAVGVPEDELVRVPVGLLE